MQSRVATNDVGAAAGGVFSHSPAKAVSFASAPMDTVFKILFGLLLGVIGCLGYDFYQAREAAKRGLEPGWVPAKDAAAIRSGSAAGSGVRAAGASRPTPPREARQGAGVSELERVSQRASANAGNVPSGGGAGSVPKTRKQPATPNTADNPRAVELLAAQKWRWPRQISLTNDIRIPVKIGNSNGFVPLDAGSTVDVVRVFADGRIHAVYRPAANAEGNAFIVRHTQTDLLGRALPEGTPAPPPPVAPPRIVSAPVETRTAPAPAPRQREEAKPREKPPKSNRAPTLFGVPID